jgi:hypothetical protein
VGGPCRKIKDETWSLQTIDSGGSVFERMSGRLRVWEGHDVEVGWWPVVEPLGPGRLSASFL